MKIRRENENTITCFFSETEISSMGYDIEDIEEDDDIREDFLCDCFEMVLSMGFEPIDDDDIPVLVEEAPYGLKVTLNNMMLRKNVPGSRTPDDTNDRLPFDDVFGDVKKSLPATAKSLDVNILKDDPKKSAKKVVEEVSKGHKELGEEDRKSLELFVTDFIEYVQTLNRDIQDKGAHICVTCKSIEGMINVSKIAKKMIKVTASSAVRLKDKLYLLMRVPMRGKNKDDYHKFVFSAIEQGFEINGSAEENRYLNEHGKKIIKENAVERLSSFV